MLIQKNDYQILVNEAHLLGDIRKSLKLLDGLGKYFYIKHYKDTDAPHYHIYFRSSSFDNGLEIQEFFLKNISTKVYVERVRMGVKPFIMYFLQNGKYKKRDIKGTLPLSKV